MRTTGQQNGHSSSSAKQRIFAFALIIASLSLALPIAFAPPARATSLPVTMTLSYELVTPTFAAGPPTFTYVYQGQEQNVTLTATPTSYQVDLGTPWSVSSSLPGSSLTERWSTQPDLGIAYNGTIVFRYYSQYLVNFGYSVVEGGTGPLVVYVYRFGALGVVGAGGPSWVDAGTSFSYPSVFESGVNDRWTSDGLSGVITAPANYTLAYNHQFYVNETFGIFGGGSFPTPVFSAVSFGTPISVALSNQVVGQWLDAGSNYSISSTAPPPTMTERWATGTPVAATVNSPLNLRFYYYHQYLVGLNYTVSDGGNITPLVTVSQYGFRTKVSAGSSAWVDSGGNFSYPEVVTSATPVGERWASSGMNETVSGPANFTLTYYHQYLYTGRYLVVGGGSGGAPTLRGTSFNRSATATLTGTNESVWLDASSTYSVTNPLPSSSSSERWYAIGTSGVISSPTYSSPVYYHQFGINASYSVVGGNSPASPALLSTSLGEESVQYLTQSPATLWIDAGSKYNVTYSLAGSSSAERWVLNGNITGTAESAFTIQAVYYHQDLLTLDFTPQAVQTATVDYRVFGEPVMASIPVGRSTYWADAGGQLLLSGSQAGSVPGSRWAPIPAPPSVLTSPLNITLSFVHQFEVTASYSVSGGGNPAPPVLVATSFGAPLVANLTQQGMTMWLDYGTGWNVSAVLPGQGGSERWIDSQVDEGLVNSSAALAVTYVHQYYVSVQAPPLGGTVTPSSGWYDAGSPLSLAAVPTNGWGFGEWKGTGGGSYSGGNSTARLTPGGPVKEVPVFDPQIRVSVGSWGSVTYVSTSGKGVVGEGVAEGLSFPAGSNVTLVASPTSLLYVFSRWGGSYTGTDGRVALTVNSPMQIQAIFGVNYPALAGVIALWAILVLLVFVYLRNRKRWNPVRLLRQAYSAILGGSKK